MVPLFQVISNIVHKGIDRINLVSKYDLWDGYYRLLFFFPFLFFFLLRTEQIRHLYG